MTTLIAPLIHLGGSPRDRLLDGYIDAIDALRTAEEKIRACYPNGRDYPPDGTGRGIGPAQKQHEDRLTRLAEVRQELEQIAEAVADQ